VKTKTNAVGVAIAFSSLFFPFSALLDASSASFAAAIATIRPRVRDTNHGI